MTGPMHESTRGPRYRELVERLRAMGLVYECFCTRREILDASNAPHLPPGTYPGTCRNLTETEREQRRRHRPHPALRLRSRHSEVIVHDLLHGAIHGRADDIVLVRGDGTAAYNLAVVVDDHDMGVDQVVRADDLLSSSPRQAYLAELLGFAVPVYAHVPLVLGPDGRRLAKRDGAVTLEELAERGRTPEGVVALLLRSMGLPPTLRQALDAFEPGRIPLEPWHLEADDVTRL